MPSVRVGQTEISYDLRRTAVLTERRITVTPDRVEVVALATDDDEAVANFVHRKRRWLFDSVRDVANATAGRAVVPRFMTGSKIPFRGRRVGLTVCRTGAARTEVIYRNGIIVDLGAGVPDTEVEVVVVLQLRLWLRRRVRLDVQEIAARYGRRFGLKPRSLRVAEMTSGWGSCGPEGGVLINWHLVFAPQRVLEYVVVHELAHLQHRSHSEEFWRFLGLLMPDFEAPRRWLDAHQGSLDSGFLKAAATGFRS